MLQKYIALCQAAPGKGLLLRRSIRPDLAGISFDPRPHELQTLFKERQLISSDLHQVPGPGWRFLKLAAVFATGWALSGSTMASDAKAIATVVCAPCHGEDGNSIIPMFPKIAGLQEEYIVKQLRDFRSGARGSDLMGPVAIALKPEDIPSLAAYFNSKKMKPGVPGDKLAAGFGKMVYLDGNEETGVPACIGCHQAQGAGHLIYPRIGGQHAPYVTHQMKDFANGERSNDFGRFMRSIARRMSAEEIHSVAEYLAGLGDR